MTQFVGIIHKDKRSDYSICFPDFPGCITAGATMQEAFIMAQEALQGHIDAMQEYKEPLPLIPLSLDEAVKHPLAKGALTFFMVEAELPSKPVRVNVMMDEGLLKRIDRVASNRSAFIADAARDRLSHMQ